MGLHNSVDNRQAQARACAFGGIQERCERALLLFLGHPLAGIPELNNNQRRAVPLRVA